MSRPKFSECNGKIIEVGMWHKGSNDEHTDTVFTQTSNKSKSEKYGET